MALLSFSLAISPVAYRACYQATLQPIHTRTDTGGKLHNSTVWHCMWGVEHNSKYQQCQVTIDAASEFCWVAVWNQPQFDHCFKYFGTFLQLVIEIGNSGTTHNKTI